MTSRLRLFVWISILSVIFLDAILLVPTSIVLQLDQETIQILLSFALFFTASFLFYRLSGWGKRKAKPELFMNSCTSLGLFLETVMQFYAFVFGYIVLSYLALRYPFPYHDAFLLQLDRSLGFNWESYASWANSHPWLAMLLFFAYHACIPQALFIFAILIIERKPDKLYAMMLAMIFASVACIAIAALFPSVGIIPYLHLDHKDYPNLFMGAGYIHMIDLEQLRDGSFRAIVLHDMKGLITFPSFHCSFAVVTAWAAWKLKWLRWPVTVISLAVLLSTPVIGGHYLVDVIGGVIIAVAAIWAAKKIAKQST